MILRPEVPIHMAARVRLDKGGEVLTAVFDAYFDPFVQVVKACGMDWKTPAWEKRLSEMTGDPHDRVAELCQRLIAAGFVVDVEDEEGARRAISGEFTPEHRRWLFIAGNGYRKGWVIVTWPRGEDFRELALGVFGARRIDWMVAIPPGAVEEAVDFAERYDFRLTKRVTQLLEEHRAALAAGAVVQTKTIEKPAAPPIGPPVLTAEAASVPDDLLDAD